ILIYFILAARKLVLRKIEGFIKGVFNIFRDQKARTIIQKIFVLILLDYSLKVLAVCLNYSSILQINYF
ncbi:MAG: hypothetical protein COS99_04110, partial [Candidatus Omnitrophica bacterium CG07_land_8_20_14_0_80_42_15]